jgi:hypothetical protein
MEHPLRAAKIIEHKIIAVDRFTSFKVEIVISRISQIYI